MDKNTLQHALLISQLLRCSEHLLKNTKDGSKRLSILRSRLEKLVMLAFESNDPLTRSQVEESLANQFTALSASFLQVVELGPFMQAMAMREGPIVGKHFRRGISRSLLNLLLEGVEDVPVVSAPSQSDVKVRAEVMRWFATAGRNFSWVPLLTRLGVESADVDNMANHLSALFGSQEGRSKLPDVLRSLCPKFYTEKAKTTGRSNRAGKPKVDASGLFDEMVVVNIESLSAHPSILELRQATSDDAIIVNKRAALLKAVTVPHAIKAGHSAAKVAQDLIDDYVAGLYELKKEADKLRLKARREAAAKAEETAVKELREMNPALLKLLKSNPDLLNRV